METDYHIDDSVAVKDATKRMKQILDTKYEPDNFDDVVALTDHLTPKEKTKQEIIQKAQEIV